MGFFVEDARKFWQYWSVRLAAIAGIAAGYLAAYPAQLQQLVAYVPEEWRPAASVAIGAIVFAVPTIVRMMQQPSPPSADND
jgi:hypothetical protein